MQKPHNNQELFSNYYLEERLPDRNIWQEPEGLTETYNEISELYEERKDILESTKEAQTEEEWIKPIMGLLGFKYITQPSESIFDTTKVPDYAFFLNEEDKTKAYKAAKDNKKKLFDFALSVGDAKRWGRNLNELSPNKQIDEYLRITDSKWGILTNGRLWRIYHLDSSYRLDTYYEVDLVGLIGAEDPEKFKYFYLFFRPRSFVEDGFLSEVYDRSEDFTASVSEDLKKNAFDALRELCQGFLSGSPELGEEDLDDIYENSLVLLYRLIFLLYAESEEEEKLLPMDNETYRETYSLQALKEEVVEKHNSDSLLSSSHQYWSRLRDLFSFIDKGEETLGVYEYNGGLFDSDRHPFFKDNSIGDKYIAKAIRKVSYSEAEGGFIDYQDLDVRELGAIYEGLLEHEPIIEEEQVKWEEDLSERKKTGSYYTPEYIVKYIVENTIGPLVEEKKEEIEEEIKELEEKLEGSRGYDRESYQKKLEEKRQEIREEILDLKVLDPAMGSGHFLVEATEKLANSIASLEEEFSPEEEHKLTDHETEKEDTVKELKRQIVERSIYGVDKNPLATELTKLSLWLHTVAKGEPLSFLDHHLRTGDSLIGIDIDEMKTMPSGKEIGSLFKSRLIQDLGKAVGHLSLIEDFTSKSRDDIQEKKVEWKNVRAWVEKYKKAANVRLSSYFGNDVKDDEYWQTLESVGNNNIENVEGEDYFKEAQRIAKEKSFFHWELEFPDVFRNENGKKKHNSGFDTAIGNPPYVTSRDLEKLYKRYLKLYFEIKGSFDLYSVFMDKSLKLTTKGSKFSFIIPDSILDRSSFSDIRKKILRETSLDILAKIKGVFNDASVTNVVFISTKSKNLGKIKLMDAKSTKEFKKAENYNLVNQRYYIDVENSNKLVFLNEDEQKLIRDIDSRTSHLSKYLGKSWRGEERGKNSVSLTSSEDGEPIIFGEDINRYIINFQGCYIPAKDIKKSDYDKRKILVRQLGDRPHAALDKEGYVTLQSTYNLLIKDNHKLKAILGILNSKLIHFYYQRKWIEKQSFPRILLENLRVLPVMKSSGIDNLLDKVSKLLDLLSKDQKEKKQFLEWVESNWGTNIDNLSLKTHLREYWNYDFDEFMRIAKRNKSKIDKDVKSRDFREQMKKEWEDTMNTLNPLMEEIQKLENEIDAIVFDLYDLNEEEVRTVLDSLETPEDEKSDILNKFRQVE